MKKFELTSEFMLTSSGIKLFRVRALVAFGFVKAGDNGGFIEKEENLSQDGTAWVYGDAQVSGNARVSGNAQVYGHAKVSDNARVYGDAKVSGNAKVSGDAKVSGNACVSGDAKVSSDAKVYGNAQVSGNAGVYGDTQVSDNAWVSGDAQVSGNAKVSGNAGVSGNAQVSGTAWVSGDAQVSHNAWVSSDADYATVKGFGRKNRTTTVFRCKEGRLRVVCGCFLGDLDDFREIVKKTHGDGKMATEYLMIADLMEMHFKGGYAKW